LFKYQELAGAYFISIQNRGIEKFHIFHCPPNIIKTKPISSYFQAIPKLKCGDAGVGMGWAQSNISQHQVKVQQVDSNNKLSEHCPFIKCPFIT